MTLTQFQRQEPSLGRAVARPAHSSSRPVAREGTSSMSKDKPAIGGLKDLKLGDGIPNFQTSFNVAGKGGGAFRAISENFSVNPANGTLSLAVPISTSPTRGAFGPDLQLVYNSGAGNGPFGFGWNIAPSSVTRKTNLSIPRYIDDEDDLAFAGMDIVPSLTNYRKPGLGFGEDYTIVEYRPTVDSRSLRIEKWTSKVDSDDIHWRTITAENVTSIYGDKDTCRILDSSGSRKRIFSWLLSRTYDANGNAMEYLYKSENGSGIADANGVIPIWEQNRSDSSRCRQKYIKRIKYGNRFPSRNLTSWEDLVWPTDWMFEVVFDYGEHDLTSPSSTESGEWPVRKDVFSQSNAGFEIRNYRLCHRVLMFHRFLEQTGRAENLVGSTAFRYDQTSQRSVLLSVTSNGHEFESETANGVPLYKTESLPPWTFSYTAPPEPRNFEALQANVTNLLEIPNLGANSATWLDLDGDGVPGLLSRAADQTLVYQRNGGYECSNECGPFWTPIALQEQPSTGSEDIGRFEDLDGNSKIDYVCLDNDGIPNGFYEREDSDSWSTYSSFPQTPTGFAPSEMPIFIDLTGDGLHDMLLFADESQGLNWQQSLGKQGISAMRRTYSAFAGPRPSLIRTAEAQTFVADTTGDGLSDLVEVSPNRIVYWPNLGHGEFGAVVEMGNPPTFRNYGEFDFARLSLVDVDGSGTTDIIYSLPEGGVLLYYNCAGNCWSDPIHIPSLSKSASSSPLFVLDILGKGTASICWADSLNSAGMMEIKYVELMPDGKPYLLCDYRNGLGASTSVSYTPSTTYYQRDEARCRPWTTKLPFPVQCISRIEVQDLITGDCAWTEYSYHNGCYDSVEKEFAGFEMVETWSQERIVIGKGETYETPLRYTKSWHNAGLGLSVNESEFFSPSKLVSCLDSVSEDSTFRALRALRGSSVRTETYAMDGSEKAHLPYAMQESSYDVKQVQGPTIRKRPVVTLTTRASLSTEYERDISDPRITHEVVLKTNDYGDVEESLRVIYPRSQTKTKVVDSADVRDNQLAGNVTFLRTQYTNAVDEQRTFRKPLPWKNRDYEIRDMSLSSFLEVDTLRQFDFNDLPEQRGASPWKALRSQHLTLYRDSSLSKVLGGGTMEAYSVPYQSYALALTPDILTKAEQSLDKHDIATTLGTALISDGAYLSSTELLMKLKTGNVDVELVAEGISDGSLWAPSSVAHYHSTDDTGDELQLARKAFYTPLLLLDAFGNRSTVTMDESYLLARQVEDAMGNVTFFVNDYEHLQPVQITDANLIRAEVALDPLGRVIAKAVTGKGNGGEDDVDSLSEFQRHAGPDLIASVLEDPSGETARRLLGNCGERILHCLNDSDNGLLQQPASMAKRDSGTLPERLLQPSLIVEISRDLSFQRSEKVKLRVSVTYLDGLGKEVQQVTLNDPTSNQERWLRSGVSASDFNGNTIRMSNPQFASIPDIVRAVDMPKIYSTSFFDAVGRQVGSLSSDHTWSKTVITPWSILEYDVGSTIACTDPRSDPDLGVFFKKIKENDYFPSWLEAKKKGSTQDQLAADQSITFSDAVTVTHIGSCGLPVQQIYTAGDQSYRNAFEYDFAGNRTRTFDSLDRLVEKNLYDKLNHPVLTSGMDSGEFWTFQDANGGQLVNWNSRGICFQYVRDALRREIERRMQRGPNLQKTVVKTVYGEDHPDAVSKNLRGQVWKINDQAGVHIHTRFDIRGRCIEQSFQPAREYKTELNWQTDNDLETFNPPFLYKIAFDNFGQAVWDQDPAGNCTRRAFSRLGREQSVDFSGDRGQTWTPYLVDAAFSADGLPLRMGYGNGVVTESVYDDQTRDLLAQNTSRRTTMGRRDFMQNLSYTYDCEGRLIRSFDSADQSTYFRNCRIDPEWKYTYDAIGRLASARGRGQLPSTTSKDVQLRPYDATTGSNPTMDNDGSRLYQYEETYEYDLEGNILSMKHEALQDPSVSGWTRVYFYEEPSLLSSDPTVVNNRLSKTKVGDIEERYDYSGDAGRVGCMTSLPKYSKMEWNMDNMMSLSSTQNFKSGTPETTYYVYDHAGNRVRKITESAASSTSTPRVQRDTLYLNGVEIQARFAGDGTQTAATRRIASVRSGGLLALIETTDDDSEAPLVRYQIGKDMELDSSGQLISYEEYSPFGAVVYSATYQDIEAPRKYRFAKYEHDRETGLYHCGARYYCPWLGRWTSPDPLGTADGLNLYAHCGNDPLNWVDPEGTSQKQVNRTVTKAAFADAAFQESNTSPKDITVKSPSERTVRIMARIAKIHPVQEEEAPTVQPTPTTKKSQVLPAPVQSKPSNSRKRDDGGRKGNVNLMSDIKTPQQLRAYQKAVKALLQQELGWWGRLKAKKGEIARKAAVMAFAAAAGAIPIVGPVVKTGINALAAWYENNLKLKERDKDDLELTAAAMLHAKNSEKEDERNRYKEIFDRVAEHEKPEIVDQIYLHGTEATLLWLNARDQARQDQLVVEDVAGGNGSAEDGLPNVGAHRSRFEALQIKKAIQNSPFGHDPQASEGPKTLFTKFGFKK